MSSVSTAAATAPETSISAVQRWLRGASRSRGLLIAVIVLAAGFAVPSIVTNAYSMQLVVDAAILALFAVSIGFLGRHLGLISLGHTAFYGGAGYLTAIATTHWGWGPTQAALLGIVGCTLAAVPMGALVVRATGMGFLMLTLALGQAVYQLSVQTAARPITGAYDGLTVTFDARRSFFGMSAQNVMNSGQFWNVVWVVLVLSVVGLWLAGRSRFGTVLEGIRENEERMRFSGYDTFWPRLFAFMLSAFTASLAGVLYAIHGSFVDPSMLSFTQAGDGLIAAIIGGISVLLGPVVGAMIYVWAEAHFNSGGNLPLYTGVTLVVVLVFLPGGVLGGVGDLVRRLAARRGRGDS